MRTTITAMTTGTAMAAMRTTTGRGRRSAASPSASRSISASCCWRSPPASSPPRWRCWPMPATTSPTCWAWSWPGSRSRLARRLPSRRRTYGFHRGTILAALANAMLLLVAVGAIALESVQRLLAPEPVATGSMLWVAAVGILVNGGTALLFARGREARHQPPRRLPAHAGRCRRLGRGGGRRAADPGDRLAMGRSGARPGHRRGYPGRHLGAAAGIHRPGHGCRAGGDRPGRGAAISSRRSPA